MSKANTKKIITAALSGAVVFCLVVTLIDYVLGRGFTWPRLIFYYIFAAIVYGFLTYRKLKKHQN